MVAALFRDILGYRAGTIVNLLIAIWIAKVVERFFTGLIFPLWKRYVVILVIMSCEYLLMNLNSYMVDLLSIPLLLEAVWLLTVFDKIRNKRYYSLYIMLLLGLSVSLKLTNLAFVIPILAAFILTMAKEPQGRPSFGNALPMFLVFLFPLLPYSIYMYVQTSNPIFPFYNGIFKSPYWPFENFKDLRWGPKSLLETVVWPVIAAIKPSRVSELNLYSGRIAIVFIYICFSLLFQKKNRRLLYIWLAGAMLWSVSTGYVRYVLFLEVLGGVIVALSLFDSEALTNKLFFKIQRPVLVCLICFQVIIAYGAAYHVEWSWRQNIFQNEGEHVTNFKYLFRDFNLSDFALTNKDWLNKPEVWVNCYPYTIAYATLLNPALPILNISDEKLISGVESTMVFSRAVSAVKGKKIFTACPSDELTYCEENVKKCNFTISSVVPIELSYYGYSHYTIYLIQLNADLLSH